MLIKVLICVGLLGAISMAFGIPLDKLFATLWAAVSKLLAQATAPAATGTQAPALPDNPLLPAPEPYGTPRSRLEWVVLLEQLSFQFPETAPNAVATMATLRKTQTEAKS